MEVPSGPSMGASIYYVDLARSGCSECSCPEHSGPREPLLMLLPLGES